jgi:ABC-2 type transport system ATP-binding protein
MMTSMTVAVSIRDLAVRRGGREVVRIPSLEIAAGTVTGLMGPSGCGKTTLMRCIVGVQRIASGDVTVLGAPAGTPALRRRVGYMTQAPSVYGDLTVRENLDFFGRVLGAAPARVEQVIGAVRVPVRLGQLVRDLSGGERARVSLAAVLLGEPELLVLDEPTVGLDPLLRVELWRMFRSMAGGGATLLVSSHSLEEARHCDHLLLMRDGALLLAEDAFVVLVAAREDTAA